MWSASKSARGWKRRLRSKPLGAWTLYIKGKMVFVPQWIEVLPRILMKCELIKTQWFSISYEDSSLILHNLDLLNVIFLYYLSLYEHFDFVLSVQLISVRSIVTRGTGPLSGTPKSSFRNTSHQEFNCPSTAP